MLFWRLQPLTLIKDIGEGETALKPTVNLSNLLDLLMGSTNLSRELAKLAVFWTALQVCKNGADLLWIETEKPHVGQIGAMVDEIPK